jgi:uroporphyrinogen decarboxylase
MKLTSRERLERTIAGETVDSIPISFWNHFPVDDQNPDALVRATLNFQSTFDFDFVKLMPPSSYCLKDWGIKDEWTGNVEGTRDYGQPLVKTLADLSKISVLDPTRGFLGNQLQVLRKVRESLPDDVPVLQTIFNPMSQAKNLFGKKHLIPFLRKHPNALHETLKRITETTLRFMSESISQGADGFFFAVQHASYDLLTRDEFQDFVLAHDSELFEAFNETWLNMLHIHGNNIMYEACMSYPVQIFNWHDRETIPSLKDGKSISNAVVCGGLNRIETMVLGNKEKIRREIQDAIDQTNGKKLIIGTGCVLPLNVPIGNIFDAVNITRNFS